MPVPFFWWILAHGSAAASGSGPMPCPCTLQDLTHLPLLLLRRRAITEQASKLAPGRWLLVWQLTAYHSCQIFYPLNQSVSFASTPFYSDSRPLVLANHELSAPAHRRHDRRSIESAFDVVRFRLTFRQKATTNLPESSRKNIPTAIKQQPLFLEWTKIYVHEIP